MDITKELLKRLYIEKSLSIVEISITLNKSKYQIKYLLRKYGLKKRPCRLGKKLYDDRDWLYNEYMIKKKGYTVIANQCGVSYTTIRDRIMHFGWSIRGHNDIDKGEARRGQKHNPESILKIKAQGLREELLHIVMVAIRRLNFKIQSFINL